MSIKAFLPVCLTFMLLFGSSHAIWGRNKNYVDEKVLLSNVHAITLRAGEETTYRRTSSVPQLKCVGGSARVAAKEIETVQCSNQGSDGIDVQWKCQADLSDSYRFGKVEVVCEGYDYPEDPYILKGSCGLEYTLEYTEKGRQKPASNSYQQASSPYHHDEDYGTSRSGSKVLNLVMIGVVAFIFYNVYKQCVRVSHGGGSHTSRGTGGSGFYPGGGGPYGGNGGGGGGLGGGANCSPSPSAPSSSWTPGFWSGLAAGGLMGRMFGGRSYGPGTGGFFGTRPMGGGMFGGGPSVGSFGGGSVRSSGGHSSSSTRTASGFGGTRRR